MRHAIRILSVSLLLGAVPVGAAESPPPRPAPARRTLADAAPSREALVEQLLAALAARDAEALKRLRVTEREYREIILPGSAKQGEPLRKYTDEQSKFFWSLLDGKSAHFEAALLNRYGGQRYRVKTLEYEQGEQEYASYRAYKQVRLLLADESGTERELATGSIAEIGGGYKFISFVRN